MNTFKLVNGIVGFVGATFLFWAGIATHAAWDHRPAGWPNYELSVGPFHHTFGFGNGPYAQIDAFKKAAKDAHAHALTVNKAEDHVTASVNTQDVAAERHIRTAHKAITKEIPVAITPTVDRAYPLPNGFVRLYDASIWGVPPIPPSASQPDDAPSAVALSAATDVITGNNAECLVDRQKLSDFQTWYTQAAEVYSAKTSKTH